MLFRYLLSLNFRFHYVANNVLQIGGLINQPFIKLINVRNFSSRAILKKSISVIGYTYITRQDIMSRMISAQSKPPNIVVYCQPSEFAPLKKTLLTTINPDRYVVYHVTDEQIESAPWADNTQLLLIKTCEVPSKTELKFKTYYKDGGKILSFDSDIFHDVPRQQGSGDTKSQFTKNLVEFSYQNQVGKLIRQQALNFNAKPNHDETITAIVTDNVSKEPLVLARKEKGCVASSVIDLTYDPDSETEHAEWVEDLKKSNQIRRQILHSILSTFLDIDCTNQRTMSLTSCYLMGDSQNVAQFTETLKPHIQNNELKLDDNLTLAFCNDAALCPSATPNRLPVITGTIDANVFDSGKYFKNLTTKNAGKILLFTHVLPTTMNVIKGKMAELAQVVAIARRQTQGQGRSGNEWLSPDGCAMVTFPLLFSRDSILGQHPVWVQHLAVLAMVDSVLTKPGYEDLDIRLKWPNDVYVGHSKTKIGGLIVKSTLKNDRFHCVVGCGLNVSNAVPTTCVNELIRKRNSDNSSLPPLAPLTVEEVVARLLNRMEELVEQFQISGYEPVTEAYKKRWLHLGCKVNLQDGGEVRLVGLDDGGYLKVELENGQVTSLDSADWNSFDLMKNLITRKTGTP